MGINKALCRFPDGTTFLERILQTCIRCDLSKILVVIGAQAEEVRFQHAGFSVEWLENSDWSNTHLMDSFRLGCGKLECEDYALQWPVDCPNVDEISLNRLILQRKAYLAVLAYGERTGHPLMWSPDALRDLRSHFGLWHSLRDFVKDHEARLQLVQAVSPSVLDNINAGNFLRYSRAVPDE